MFYEVAVEVLHLAGVPPALKERVYELMRVGDDNPLEKLFPPDYPDPAATLKRIVDERMAEWMRRYHYETEAVPGGRQIVVDMDLPQSVVAFGTGSIPQRDPDYMAAFVLNHILGGGGFASRLMEEVRVKRGLAYAVWSSLVSMRHASVLRGGVATRNEMVGQSLDIIRAELEKMRDGEISQADLHNARSYLIGSYPLRFDANAKIAGQLLSLRMDGFGIDYVDKRNAMIAAVTLDDLKRVAKRMLEPENLIVTVVGKPVLRPETQAVPLEASAA
jgi:zinc protease